MPKVAARSLLFIFLALGILWLRSSYNKFASGNFADNLGVTLSKVVDKNPYPWFKSFLEAVVIPNSKLFGYMVLWGELLVAVAITLGAIMLLINPQSSKLINWMLIAGLAGGLLLNIIFWLSFGWTSPSTDSVNLLMAVIEIIGILFLLF